MKIEIKTLKGLEVMNGLLREQNILIKNRLEARERGVINSLQSISGPWGQQGQTPITSINPLIQNNIWNFITLDWMALAFAYKTQGLIQTLCDMPVLDAFRGGIEIHSKELDQDDHESLMKDWKQKRCQQIVGQSQVWTRLMGGGALLTMCDSPANEPLDERVIKRTGMVDFYSAHRWEIISPWRVSPSYDYYGTIFDVSRVITMAGKEAPNPLGWMLQGWGMSELERAIEDFNTYIRVKNVIYELLYEAKIDVFKFKDFANQMLSAEAEQKTRQRLEMMNSSKNYNSAVCLDAEDEFEQRTMTFSGLAEIYREARLEISSAWRIPMSKLFGIPSTGFSSGEDDRENYHEMIEAEVREPLRPVILYMLKLLCLARFKFIPDDLDFSFKPLRLLGAKEQEEVDTSKFNRAVSLYDRGLIDTKGLGDMLLRDKLIDTDIKLEDNPEPPMTEFMDPKEEGGEGKPKEKESWK